MRRRREDELRRTRLAHPHHAPWIEPDADDVGTCRAKRRRGAGITGILGPHRIAGRDDGRGDQRQRRLRGRQDQDMICLGVHAAAHLEVIAQGLAQARPVDDGLVVEAAAQRAAAQAARPDLVRKFARIRQPGTQRPELRLVRQRPIRVGELQGPGRQ
ncbi:hypothetical protein chiPu_0033230 [Chiloscyllium punctatum]|uniref:Uncharacterized protein n=1 Tax=Chiloscyllium punctatum TaxID=137246 RepID=A0A401U1L0_CHIPU|nr:hypothetical protein [Chiloscyllium punctatum]